MNKETKAKYAEYLAELEADMEQDIVPVSGELWSVATPKITETSRQLRRLQAITADLLRSQIA